MIFIIYPVNALNSDLWCSAICDSQYSNNILQDVIPTQTDDSNIILSHNDFTYGNDNQNAYPYKLFDKQYTVGTFNDVTSFYGNSPTLGSGSLTIDLDLKQLVSIVKLYYINNAEFANNNRNKTVKLYYYNEATQEWTNVWT